MNLFERIRADLFPQGDIAPPQSVAIPRASSSLRISAGGSSWAETAFREEIQRIYDSRPANRNNTVNRVAFSLGQIVAGGELDRDRVIAAIFKAATDMGQTPEETRKTIESGMTSGAREPRRSSDFLPTPEEVEELEIHDLRGELLTTYDLDNLPIPEPIIEGMFFAGTPAWVIGEPNAGKSLFTLDWANCIAAGIPWKGRRVKQGRVLYVVAEGETGIRNRVRAWEKQNGLRTPDVLYLPRDVQVLDDIDWTALERTAHEVSPTLMVIDTQAQCTIGIDENSVKEMGPFIRSVKRIARDTGACVMPVHHIGKGGSIRGTSSIQGAATTIVKATIEDQTITLTNRLTEGGKQKDAASFPDMRFTLTEHELDGGYRSVTLEPELEIVF